MTARPLDAMIVLAKSPVPGRVKTRLAPEFSGAEAAELAGAALHDTLDAVDAMPIGRRVLAFDGAPGHWLRPGWTDVRQVEGGQATRMAAAFATLGPGSGALVAMDTPQLSAAHVATVDLDSHDAILGLTRDGGYWTIGFRDARAASAALDGVPMSTGDTGEHQLRRLREIGLRVQLLEELIDVDSAADAYDVAAAAPATRFARALRRVTSARAVR